MAKTSGITKCECDRCGAKEYLTETSPTWSDWHTIKRYTGDAVEVSRLLCRDCFTDYKTLMSEQDAGFNDFMKTKGGE